ncbi:MAG: hypothetical protein KAZ30_00070 [Candidatus Magasanikbacteria bacterium]|nr:hypothetical protein [Candidatus Magasanikbacteria bacterium]
MSVRRTAKPVRRRTVKSVHQEEMPESQVQEIRHHHNIVDLKVAIALAFVVVSSMVITVYAKSPTGSLAASTSTPSVVPTSTGRLLVAAKTDFETVSKIMTPTTSTPVTVAKWTVAAELEPVALQRVRFNVINGDYSVRTTASEFGQLSLYDNYSSEALATAPFVGGTDNGYVEFNVKNFVIQPGQPRVLTLKSTINGSGIMKENSMVRFGVTLAASKSWQAVGVNSGKYLETKSIRFGVASYGAAVLSSLHLYHNAVPVVYPQTFGFGAKLEKSPEAKVFAFLVNGTGDRELRLSKMLVNISVNGMNNSGYSSSTGSITKFALHEVTGNGQLGPQLAVASGCLVSPKTGGAQMGSMVISGYGTCAIGNIYVTFDKNNDVNGALDSLTVPVGSSRRFMVVANTTNSFTGKMSGAVTVSGKIAGTTGTFPSSDPKKPFWSGGGIFYHYTPVGGSENVAAYNQTDTYPVVGYPLSLSM